MIDSSNLAIGLAVGASGMMALAAVLWGRKVCVHRRGGVVVTGASTGIGRHAAESLAAEGYTVFAGVRKEADAENLKKVCPAAVPVILDVCSQDSVDKAVQTIQGHLAEKGITLVALVNNAGIGCFFPVEFADMDVLRSVYEVNVFGCVRVSKACLPLLRKTGAGARIVNIGSILGFFTTPGGSAYCGTKHAVQAFTNSLRLEVEQFGMWACTINPGYVRTEIINKSSGTPPSEEATSTYAMVYSQRSGVREAILSACLPDVTSKAILHAIRSPRPWTRYIVAAIDGLPAWVLAWFTWYLPKQWQDALLLAGLKAKHGRQA